MCGRCEWVCERLENVKIGYEVAAAAASRDSIYTKNTNFVRNMCSCCSLHFHRQLLDSGLGDGFALPFYACASYDQPRKKNCKFLEWIATHFVWLPSKSVSAIERNDSCLHSDWAIQRNVWISSFHIVSLARCTPSRLLCVCATHIIGIIPCRLRNSLLLIEQFRAIRRPPSRICCQNAQLPTGLSATLGTGCRHRCCRQSFRPFFLLFMISIFALISVRETEKGTKNFSRHFILCARRSCARNLHWNGISCVCVCCACSLHRKCTRYAWTESEFNSVCAWRVHRRATALPRYNNVLNFTMCIDSTENKIYDFR